MTRKNVTPGAYGILCLQNRKFYIGSSSNIEKRIADHRSQLRGGRHLHLPRLQKDWNELGEGSFAFARFPCPPQHRKHYEQRLIESLKTLEHQQGYNKMNGGKWGVEASIRNSETKLIRYRKFQHLPNLEIESPIDLNYIATLIR